MVTKPPLPEREIDICRARYAWVTLKVTRNASLRSAAISCWWDECEKILMANHPELIKSVGEI